MERNEIIDACEVWAQEKKNRVAVVILAEPDKDGGKEDFQSSKFVYGDGGLLACTLGHEINDDREFAIAIHTAAKVAFIMKMEADCDSLGDKLSDLFKKEK